MFFVVYIALPGSTRSGEKARKMSRPTLKPFCSNIGTRTSSVVPGYVVLSSTISMSLWMYFATCPAASTMLERSGSFVLRNGVGTQMLTVSASASAEKSEVARSSPAATASRIASEGISPMYDFPARMLRTLEPFTSMPITWMPAPAYSTASGSPTYPKPITAAVKFFRFSRAIRSPCPSAPGIA